MLLKKKKNQWQRLQQAQHCLYKALSIVHFGHLWVNNGRASPISGHKELEIWNFCHVVSALLPRLSEEVIQLRGGSGVRQAHGCHKLKHMTSPTYALGSLSTQRKYNSNSPSSHGWCEDETGWCSAYCPLNQHSTKLALQFLDQHLASVDVMAKGSLALVLNGQLMPGKDTWEAVLPASLLPLFSPFLLLPTLSWWFPHLQEMTVFWIFWEPGHSLEARKQPQRVQTWKRHTLKLPSTGS